jgi:hypothetical protein
VVISKRERITAIIAIATIGILVLDHFIVQPLIDRHSELTSDIERANGQLLDSNRILNKSKLLSPKWAEMLNNGGLRRGASETESQLQNNVVAWAQDAGLTLPAVKSDRTEKEKEFNKFTVRATGTGTMQQIGRFLHRIQTATVPVRVTELTITSRKEGTDDLSIQMAISTIYLASEADKPQKPGGGAAPAGGGGNNSAAAGSAGASIARERQ